MADQAKAIEVKVYLEGILIPVHRVQIVESLGRTAQASLQVPMNESALDIKPRTTVHVFYKDTKTEGRWLLVFEGEVSGVSLSKSTDTRMVMLDCVSIANNWEFTSKTGISLNAYNNVASQATTKVKVEFSTQRTKADSVPKDIEENINVIKAMSGDPNTPIVGTVTTEQEVEKLARTATGQLAAVSAMIEELGGIASIVAQILKAGDDTVDSIGILAREISNSYAKINPGYFMPHVVYRIAERFFGFYNGRIASLIQSDLTSSMFEQRFKNLNNGATMITALMQVLELLNYKMITPAAPTYDDETGAPQSYVLLPNPSSFAPMACNTIFKDQVINANFSRSFLSEPTRMAGITNPGTMTLHGGDDGFLNTLLIAPNNRLTYAPEDSGAASVQLTKEERMRGVNGTVMQTDFDGLVSRIEAERLIKDPAWYEFWKQEDYEQEKQRYILDTRKRYLDSEFQASVLRNRSFNLTTTYSPYRIVGMPGLFLDDRMPSVYGVVGQISTTLSADGSSSSSINFINPILLRGKKAPVMTNHGSLDSLTLEQLLVESGWPIDDTKDKEILKAGWPFEEGYSYIPPGKVNSVVLSKGYENTSDKRGAWIALLRHRLKNPEESKFLNSWFDEEIYFPDQIGHKVYMKMAYGVPYDAEKAPLADSVGGPRQDGWGLSDDRDDAYFKSIDSTLDGSVGKFRDTSGTMDFGVGLKDNIENTEWMSHFIYKLNAIYNTKSEEERMSFINRFTRRNIITEPQLWDFLIGQRTLAGIDRPPVTQAEIDKYEATMNDMRLHNWNTDIIEAELAAYKSSRPKGIRSIMGSLSDERADILELQRLNGTNASAPFIRERRQSVRALQNALRKGKQGDYYIDI